MRGYVQRRPRGFLIADHNDLIDAGVEVFRQTLSDQGLRGREPSLQKISYEKGAPSGKIVDATLEFSVEFFAPASLPVHNASTGMPVGRRSRVTIPIKVRDGVMRMPRYFVSSSGTKHALTDYGLYEFLNEHPAPLIRKRTPGATISWAPEGDYRAF